MNRPSLREAQKTNLSLLPPRRSTSPHQHPTSLKWKKLSSPQTLRARAAGKCARLLLVFWLLQSLTAQILPRLLLFIYFFVGRADRFLDHLAVHSLDLQISDHPSAPEFFVIAAEG